MTSSYLLRGVGFFFFSIVVGISYCHVLICQSAVNVKLVHVRPQDGVAPSQLSCYVG
jgi:hypothetical protein